MSVSRRVTIALIVASALAAGCGAETAPQVVVATPTARSPANTSETWIRTYGGNQNTDVGHLILADDGGFLLTGTTNMEFEPEMRGDLYLIRMDPAGEILWQRTYGGGGRTSGRSVARISDNRLMVTGAIRSDAGNADAYVIVVDQDGNEIWSQTYGGPLDEHVKGQQTADGGYILWGNIVDPDDFVTNPGAAGYGGFEARSSIYALRLDENGDELWSRTLDTGENVLATAGLVTADGGLLVLATIMYFPDPGDDIYLVKFDADGNVAWERVWEQDQAASYDIIPTSDGHYLIAGSIESLEDQDAKEDFLLIKIDSEGNEIWSSTFGDPDMIDYGVRLAETSDGGFVTIAERTRDHYTWEADILLVKVDADGQLEWQQVIPAFHTMLRGVLEHPDGGYVVAGAIYEDPAFNIILIRTDSEGNVSD